MKENIAIILLYNIASALSYVADQGMVHRDIKLENILLAEKNSLETKILDFGFIEKINRDKLVSKAGTPGYIPPEVF